MSLPYKYQIFNNVQTIEDALGNIKLMAESNGWTIDKDDISDNQELYLHSSGNGSQNLYFSLAPKLYIDPLYRFYSYGNTGFDSSLAADAQPGRYSTNYSVDTVWNAGMTDTLVSFPTSIQYILANSSNLVSFFDLNVTVTDFSATHVLVHTFIGSIDSYKSNETEGNFQLSSSSVNGTSRIYSVIDNYFSFVVNEDHTSAPIGGLFYNGSAQQSNAKFGIYSLSYIDYFWNPTLTWYTYPRYDAMVKYNTTTSRTTLIKPIIYIKQTTDTDTYFYPIGETPYYACKAYPYSKAGDIISAGTKKFMIFPLLKYTDSNGVAFEVID